MNFSEIYKKLFEFGADTLTDNELLAIFLQNGNNNKNTIELAKILLHKFGSFHSLINVHYNEINKIKGIDKTKYAQLRATIELSRRYFNEKIYYNNCLTDPKATKTYLFHHFAEKERESFIVIFLNNQHCVIKTTEMFLGTINRVEVHPREIIKEALKLNAASLILAHNHPSGEIHPSKEDCILTNNIKKCCLLFDLRVLDHFIIGDTNYFSFAENQLI